ncbi:hypothetical protein DY000_02001963, partial [Brassica cretica]
MIIGRFLRRSRRRLSSQRVPPASAVCSVGRPIETTTDDHSLGPHGVYVCLLRQKTDPNPPWTTIMSVLTASPPDWRFSQVSGDRCGGEEVHKVKTSGDCVVNYGRDQSSSSRVFEKSLEIGRSQSFSSRLKLLLLSVKQLLLPTGAQSESSQATSALGDQPTKRPPGVKAAKAASDKRSITVDQAASEFQTMWTIKEKDMAEKERLKKMGFPESLICKKEPLSEYEEELKKKLISEIDMKRVSREWKRVSRDVSQSESSQATSALGDQPTKRPPGVKAAKAASGKRSIAVDQAASEFQTMWTIKEKDMAAKERLKKMGLLESLICKKEPLSEYGEELKKNLINMERVSREWKRVSRDVYMERVSREWKRVSRDV